MGNMNLLKSKFVAKGFTMTGVAEEMGLNKSTLSLKMNDKLRFTQDDVKGLVAILELSPEDVMNIFFT